MAAEAGGSTRPGKPTLLFWSGGKDSAFALHELRRTRRFRVVELMTTVSRDPDRIAMHGVRAELLDRQIRALGLPLRKVRLPFPSSNAAYEAALTPALVEARQGGILNVAFGDLFLEDLRTYRESYLRGLGMEAVFPLWGRDTLRLAREIIASGQRSRICCLDPRRLAPGFSGRWYDESFLRDLPGEVDPCGENGEFHTFVTHSPEFRGPVDVRVAKVYERDGFVYSDLVPS